MIFFGCNKSTTGHWGYGRCGWSFCFGMVPPQKNMVFKSGAGSGSCQRERALYALFAPGASWLKILWMIVLAKNHLWLNHLVVVSNPFLVAGDARVFARVRLAFKNYSLMYPLPSKSSIALMVKCWF